MRKKDKKLDNQLRVALTDICETALKDVAGFEWLTHLVNYADFPKSLKVVCVFDTNDNHHHFMKTESHDGLNRLIQKKLLEIGIKVNNITNHLSYDTQENCDKNNSGKWAGRLAK